MSDLAHFYALSSHMDVDPQRLLCLPLQDGEELKMAINNKLPAKIDIGPVYNVDPKHRNAYTGTCHIAKTPCTHADV